MVPVIEKTSLNPLLCTYGLILIVSLCAFFIGQRKIAYKSNFNNVRPLAPIHFYGYCLCLWTFISGCGAVIIGQILEWTLDLKLLGIFNISVLSIIGGMLFLNSKFHARVYLEKILRYILKGSAAIAVAVTIAIFMLLMFESINFFKWVPISEFLLGTHWSPSSSLGLPSGTVSGHYGVLPLLCGTLLITAIAMIIAVPLGLLIAIYTAEYASSSRRRVIKPIIEILAGVPTIIYGFFALIAVAPLLHKIGQVMGLPIAAESALGAGLVMGLMIIPFVSSLSDEALTSIPKTMRENSWALGATSAETILKVVMPAAIPGIASAILLAFSRAIGETMLVVMAAGLTAHLTLNPLDSVTTITVQIVSLLTGDQEFNSPKTLSAFALSLLLFLCTLILNIIAVRIMRWHREKYAV